MISSVSFIGLGGMGWHMASHLPKVCDNVKVWNRNFDKAEQHSRIFGTQAVSLQEAIHVDVIFSCLPTSADIEGLVHDLVLKPGTIWIDCTSGVPESAQKLSMQLAKQGVIYLDAPVSGQTIGAEKGTLTVMVAGDEIAFEKVKPIISAFAELIEYVGESGAGFSVKAINNMLMAVNLWSVAEGLCVLKAKGVQLGAALNCINHSSGRSGISENIFAQRIFSRTFEKTFALDLLQKDIGIAIDLMDQQYLQLQMMQLIHQQFAVVERAKAKEMDFSAVVKVLENTVKLKLC